VDATISITAVSGNIGINEPQTFIVTVKEDDGSGAGLSAGSRRSVTVSLIGTNGAVVNELSNTCASTDARGSVP
jgi:hypothetical protein